MPRPLARLAILVALGLLMPLESATGSVADSRLARSTYLGGDGFGMDVAYGIAVDDDGAIYVAGPTVSEDFPVTPGAYMTTNPGNFSSYVAKLSPDGTRIEYATYLGGSNVDIVEALTVDEEGRAYVTGYTRSTDFPTTDGAPQRHDGGGDSADAFVARLSPEGDELEYATYLGGNGWDRALDIELDPQGRVVVGGFTGSSNFPTASPFQAAKGGAGDDAFVTRLSADGSTIEYSTFLGGAGAEVGEGIAVGSDGSIHVTGITTSTDFPTEKPFQPILIPGLLMGDAFVTKLTPDGSALAYSSFLGGIDGENAQDIDLDAAGNAYVAGLTRSPNFPVTLTAAQLLHGGSFDAFLTRVDADGSLGYSTLIGGRGADFARGVTVEPDGTAWVTGETGSTNLPTADPLQASAGGGTDAFVTAIDAEGLGPTGLVLSTYLGGAGEDFGHAMAVVGDTVHLAGYSTSDNFPTAGPQLQPGLRGRIDAIAALLDLSP